MQTLTIEPIGVIRTPYTSLEDMPIQPGGGRDVLGELLIEPQYGDGLADLDGFSHLYLIYLFHRAAGTEMRVVPFMDDRPRGVFATRAPVRPNHIGLSVVELVEVTDCRVKIRNIDVLDGTPLLDIKPYIEAFDVVAESRSGWMEAPKEEVEAKRSDDRFNRKI
jgi:tRNA-Thr(GGU) m(6)t(6)A37 methyltransferase TsaA